MDLFLYWISSYIPFLFFHFLLVNSHNAIPSLSPIKPDGISTPSVSLDLDEFPQIDVTIPAPFVFGASWVDSGNWKKMFNKTLIDDASSPAYGMDFPANQSNRQTNGRNMADFIAQVPDLPFPYPYLYFDQLSTSIRTGANYAFVGCRILPDTGIFSCLNIDRQINLFNQSTMMNLQHQLKPDETIASFLSKSLFLVNIGDNDLDVNDKFTKNNSSEFIGKYLSDALSKSLKRLYNFGARKFLVANIFPKGCAPFTIAKKKPTTPCVEEEDKTVTAYNSHLPGILKKLESTLEVEGSKFAHIDVYKVFEDVFASPASFGISNTTHPCCTPDKADINNRLCVASGEICPDRRRYMFLDGFHPTEAMHYLVVTRCLNELSMCSPMTLTQLLQIDLRSDAHSF